jgi:hypothetical protein
MKLLACSGAKTEDVITLGRYNESPQIQALESLRASPRLITITIGGNDIGFKQTLKDCLLHNCMQDGFLARRMYFVNEELRKLLIDTLLTIELAAPGARVVLVGYPSIVPKDYSQKRGCGLPPANDST